MQTMTFLTGSHIPKTTTKTSWIWLLNLLQSQRYWHKCEFIWYFSICFIWFNFTTWLHFCGLVSTIYCFWLVVPLFTRSALGISCKAFFFQNLFNGIFWVRLPHMFQCGVFILRSKVPWIPWQFSMLVGLRELRGKLSGFHWITWDYMILIISQKR